LKEEAAVDKIEMASKQEGSIDQEKKLYNSICCGIGVKIRIKENFVKCYRSEFEITSPGLYFQTSSGLLNNMGKPLIICIPKFTHLEN